jgi:protein-S-isoprenylcysteine O-methyltransferase Ste14
VEAWISRHRNVLIRLIVLLCVPVVLLSHHSWDEEGALDEALDVAGAALVTIGVLGRIWSTLYIAGRKNNELVVAGPYSICRNPLYLFTIFIVAGLLCVFENVLMVAPVAALVALTHVASVHREERRLADLFGPAFAAYVERVPRLVPNPLLYQGAARGYWSGFNRQVAYRGIRDTAAFVLLVPVAELVEAMHLHGLLPVCFHC